MDAPPTGLPFSSMTEMANLFLGIGFSVGLEEFVGFFVGAAGFLVACGFFVAFFLTGFFFTVTLHL